MTATVPAQRTAPEPGGIDRQLLMVASVVVLGAIMSILDVTVVNVAITVLAEDFQTDLATIQWVATGYTLALATVIPLSGWSADRFGTKRVYATSLVLFVLGSAAAAFAWSAGSLIAFRVLQGLGGGLLMPVGMTILTRAAGPQRVGRVMAIIGIPMMLGPIAGPILGGWLVDAYSWHWIFLINVPIGAAALVLTLKVLPRDVPQPGHRLDWLGLALLSPGLAALIYGLAESASSGGFGDARVLVPMVLGAAALVGFVVHALRADAPLVDLRLFANRTYGSSTATLLLVGTGVFGSFLLLPLYLQTVRGEDAMSSGLLLAPQGVGAMLMMPLAGQLADRTGIGRIVPVGLALILGSFVALTQLTATTSYWLFGGLLFVQGLGMGLTMMPTFTGAIQTLRRRDIAGASTTLNIVQQVGASLGTALLSIVLTRQLADRLGAPVAAGEGGVQLPPEVAAQAQGLMAQAFGSTFWVAAGLVAVALVVAAVLLPKHKPEPVVDEDGAEGVPAPVLLH